MKKILLFMMAVLAICQSVGAESFTVDGLQYSIDKETKEATLTKCIFGEASSNVVIPTTVTFEGEEYTVTEIGRYAFMYDGLTGLNITSLVLPENLRTIGFRAFCLCEDLKGTITIPESVIGIGQQAFYRVPASFRICPNKDLYVSTGKFTGNYMGDALAFTSGRFYFYGDYYINENFARLLHDVGYTSLKFPGNCTIGESAFSGLDKITEVSFTGDATIETKAFYQCPDLANVVTYGPTTIGYGGFASCPKLTSVSINGPTTIGNSAFIYCNNLQVLSLGGETIIGPAAFKDCAIQLLYMENCKSIGANAFSNNAYIGCIWSFSQNPPVVEDVNAFEGVSTDHWPNSSTKVTVFVPLEYLKDYKEADGWSSFVNYVGMGKAEVTFTPEEIHLGFNKSDKIEYSIATSGGYEYSNPSLVSSDDNVVQIQSDGSIKGVDNGMAAVYLKYENNYYLNEKSSNYVLVTVGYVDFQLVLQPEKTVVDTNATTTIAAEYGGQGYTVETEEWSSSNPEVATVDDKGVVTGISEGSAVITLKVTFDNGLSTNRKCQIEVETEQDSSIEGIEADGNQTSAEYYTVNGVRVSRETLTPGLYIKRQGGKTSKVLVK